jgi:L-lactate dehydrogenase (cytochrome)
MHANASDFQRYGLSQRVLHDVSNIDTSTILSGQVASMPLALAPIGFAGMMARRGEAQAARAAVKAGVPFTTSTVGICPLEEVQEAINAPFWFQLYMVRDRGLVESLLQRAKSAGCDTLMFTVDLPVAGMRHRDFRNGMLGGNTVAKLAKAVQIVARPRWVFDVAIRGKPHQFGNLTDAIADPNNMEDFKRFIDSQFDPTVTWKDIEWLRSLWDGRLLIKGVMTAEDAHFAADAGADGIVVSNHGGRQLDGVPSTITSLPAISEAVGDQIEVFLDGGVRNGIDVLKAVALGARGVLIGRPWVWAMAARGESGLVDLLSVFQQEIKVAMALTGVSRIDQIDPGLLSEKP